MASTSTCIALALLLCFFFAASAVAVPDNSHRRAVFLARQESNTTTVSQSSKSASASIFSSSSSSVSKSSSRASSSSSSSSASSRSSSASASASSSSTSSSTTSVITTTSSSRSSSVSSVAPSSVSTSATSRRSANLVATVTKASSTTVDVAPNLATSSVDEPSPSASGAPRINAASSGFWGNKVGGTFTVVALVVVGILIALALVLRRRRSAENITRDTFYDTKPPDDRIERFSSRASMVSLGNQPLDAHSTPAPNYGAADRYLVDTADYNVSYPPGASYDHSNADYPPAPDTAQQYYTTTADQYYPSTAGAQEPYYADGNAYDNYNQYYSTGAAPVESGYNVASGQRPSLSPHPYSHPSHAAGAPPSAMRDFAGRDSAYQQSIDSFYGAAGTAR